MATARKMDEGKKAKETIEVKVGAFPGGTIKSYTLATGSTIEDALKAAKLNGSRDDKQLLDIRVNGQKAGPLRAKLANGAQVLVFSQVRGN